MHFSFYQNSNIYNSSKNKLIVFKYLHYMCGIIHCNKSYKTCELYLLQRNCFKKGEIIQVICICSYVLSFLKKEVHIITSFHSVKWMLNSKHSSTESYLSGSLPQNNTFSCCDVQLWKRIFEESHLLWRQDWYDKRVTK